MHSLVQVDPDKSKMAASFNFKFGCELYSTMSSKHQVSYVMVFAWCKVHMCNITTVKRVTCKAVLPSSGFPLQSLNICFHEYKHIKEWSKGYGFEEFFEFLSMTVIDTICCQFSNEDTDKILNSLIHWKVKTPVLKTIQVDRIVEREVRDGNLVCRKEVFKGKIIRKTSALYHTWCLHQSFLILLLILSSTGQEIWVARSDVSYQVFFIVVLDEHA